MSWRESQAIVRSSERAVFTPRAVRMVRSGDVATPRSGAEFAQRERALPRKGESCA